MEAEQAGTTEDAGVQVVAIENLFTYHAPTSDQPQRYARIREAAKRLAYEIHTQLPEGPDRSAAIRKLRETVMTANAGIATGGGFYK